MAKFTSSTYLTSSWYFQESPESFPQVPTSKSPDSSPAMLFCSSYYFLRVHTSLFRLSWGLWPHRKTLSLSNFLSQRWTFVSVVCGLGWVYWAWKLFNEFIGFLMDVHRYFMQISHQIVNIELNSLHHRHFICCAHACVFLWKSTRSILVALLIDKSLYSSQPHCVFLKQIC